MSDVEHDAAGHRFVARVSGGEAELRYRPQPDGGIDLNHTEVPSAARGQGVGDQLVRAALDWARANARRVSVTCPYVSAWMRRHPDVELPRGGAALG